MKTYRLKKDLPNLKAGRTIEQESGERNLYSVEKDDSGHYFSIYEDVIESNPDWFELVTPSSLKEGDKVVVIKEHPAWPNLVGRTATIEYVNHITEVCYGLQFSNGQYISWFRPEQLALFTDQQPAKWTDEDLRKFAYFFTAKNYNRIPAMHELGHWFKKWLQNIEHNTKESDREYYSDKMREIDKNSQAYICAIDILKKENDKALAAGCTFRGYLGLPPEDFTKQDLIMILNTMTHKNHCLTENIRNY